MAARDGRDDLRPTPYGLVFAHELFEGRLFPAIRDEAAERGAATRSFETFLGLEEVRELLERLVPDDEAGDVHSGTVVAQHARLLHHAFHYWLEDRPMYRLQEMTLRRLLAGQASPPPAETRPPRVAGYVQFPPNVLWSRVDAAAAPEPVDGFFWTRAVEGAAGRSRIELAYVLGVRAGRPGFSQLDAGVPLADGVFSGFEAEPARPDGTAFANILPGGDLGELHAMVTTTEALVLAGRVFHYVVSHRDALRDVGGIIVVPEVDGQE